jgi:hypothetical protein
MCTIDNNKRTETDAERVTNEPGLFFVLCNGGDGFAGYSRLHSPLYLAQPPFLACSCGLHATHDSSYSWIRRHFLSGTRLEVILYIPCCQSGIGQFFRQEVKQNGQRMVFEVLQVGRLSHFWVAASQASLMESSTSTPTTPSTIRFIFLHVSNHFSNIHNTCAGGSTTSTRLPTAARYSSQLCARTFQRSIATQPRLYIFHPLRHSLFTHCATG